MTKLWFEYLVDAYNEMFDKMKQKKITFNPGDLVEITSFENQVYSFKNSPKIKHESSPELIGKKQL